MKIDLLIHSAAQIATCVSPGRPKRGVAMQDVGVITNGAIAISDGLVVALGESHELCARYTATRTIDASGRLLCPGFVDPHTHLIYAGDRANEWEQKLRGATYLEILAAGGGILSTMRATRAAPIEVLTAAAQRRLSTLFHNGVTTCEIKTGYGLNTESEIKMLRVIDQLAQSHPCQLIPTLLAAHTIPPEYKADPNGYVDLIIGDIIPQAAAWRANDTRHQHATALRCDVFCEQNAFDVEQARRILLAGMTNGMTPTIHVDQFNPLGGVAMALEIGAISCDHLDVTTAHDRARLANSQAVATVLPAVSFHLGSTHYADARALIDAGCALALSTDHNPGSAPCLSPEFVMALACRHQKLTPAEALNACTINAAHALGLGASIGSLEAGKQADVLIIDAPDYRHLAYTFGAGLVHAVVKCGQVWE